MVIKSFLRKREHVLRALRKERGLTQAAVGELIGVGQARVAEIENNPGVVSVDQLMKLLSALRVSLLLRDGGSTPATQDAEEFGKPRKGAW
jgi:HTH-type transcriptional regulator/antitoxin HipB